MSICSDSSHCAARDSGFPVNFLLVALFNLTSGMRLPASKTVFQSEGMKRPRCTGYRHRKKQVIMGRDFLLVNRACLHNSNVGKGFQFFHTPSLSTAVVRVKKVSLVDITVELPDSHLAREDIPIVHKDGGAMVGMLEPPSPPVPSHEAKGDVILMDISVQAVDDDCACLSHVPPSTLERADHILRSTLERADHISRTLHSRVKRIIGLQRHGVEGSRQS